MSRLRRKKLAESNACRYISFADPTVKSLCVTDFDTTGNGKVSKREAASVKTAWDWSGNTNITKFNELKYFTGLAVSPSFKNCTSLEEVTIPSTMTEIGAEAFNACKLATFDFKNVSSIGNYAFKDCTSLVITKVPSTTTMGAEVFANTASVDVEIPASYTIIPKGIFSGCTKLKTAALKGNVTRIGDSAFYNCTLLTTINLPDTLVEVGASAFRYCSSLVMNGLPPLVTKLEDAAFGRCNFDTCRFTQDNIDRLVYFGSDCVNIPKGDVSCGYLNLTLSKNKTYKATCIRTQIFKFIDTGDLTTIDEGIFGNVNRMDLMLYRNIIDTITGAGWNYAYLNNLVWQDGGSANVTSQFADRYAYGCTLRDIPSNFSGTLSGTGPCDTAYICRNAIILTYDWTSVYENTPYIFTYQSLIDEYAAGGGTVQSNVYPIGGSVWVTQMKALATGRDDTNEYDWTDEFVDYDILGISSYKPAKDDSGVYKTMYHNNLD